MKVLRDKRKQLNKSSLSLDDIYDGCVEFEMYKAIQDEEDTKKVVRYLGGDLEIKINYYTVNRKWKQSRNDQKREFLGCLSSMSLAKR